MTTLLRQKRSDVGLHVLRNMHLAGSTAKKKMTAFKHSDGHLYDWYSEDRASRLCHWAEILIYGVCDYRAVRTRKGCAKKAKAYSVCNRCYLVQKAQSDAGKARREHPCDYGMALNIELLSGGSALVQQADTAPD